MNTKIACGIVLYNPEITVLKKNINSLNSQVDFIFLYDNGSDNYLEIKEIIKEYKNVGYYRNDNNKGIAYALNRIINLALKDNYEWCLTMDQDSICASNLISEYVKYLDYDKIAMICPFILNNNKYTVESYKKLDLAETELVINPIDCITSACLTNTKIIEEIGGFNEKLFIDYVDTEINCRVMKKGYKILRVNSTYLIQSMGKGKKIYIFSKLYNLSGNDVFRRLQTASVYNYKRLYFQSRNSTYIRRKYDNSGSRMSKKFMIGLFVYFSLFYPLSSNRIKMWKNILKGFNDAKRLE